MTHTPFDTCRLVLAALIWRLLYSAPEKLSRCALLLLVIIYSYISYRTQVLFSLFLSLSPATPSPRWRIKRPGCCCDEKDREREGKSSGARACCGTRVCQCLPVSTPTYLCKSFNLTPPYRVLARARARVSRERSYLETYSYSLPRRWGTSLDDPQQPYDRVSLVPMLPPTMFIST